AGIPAPVFKSKTLATRRMRASPYLLEPAQREPHLHMTTPLADTRPLPRPRHVAVVGAAGGLGQGILSVCRDQGIGFTAIVRSRPERITNVPRGSQIAVVPSFTDCT